MSTPSTARIEPALLTNTTRRPKARDARNPAERRLHPDVRLGQRLDPDLTGALQHGGVGAHVELDRVPPGPGGVSRRRFHSGQSISGVGIGLLTKALPTNLSPVDTNWRKLDSQ